MRMLIAFNLAFIVLLATCTSKDTAEVSKKESNKLEGAWEIVYSKYTSTDTTIERTQIENPSTKILTSTHFAFGWQSDDGKEVWSGGGRYTLDGDTYTEIIEYHSAPELVGKSISFNCRLEGDKWYNSGNLLGYQMLEIWRRIK